MESLGVIAKPARADRPADAWARTTAIAVTHDSGRVIGPCLESLRRAARVVVVDNASRDDCVARARALLPAAEIIENPVGLGYGNGANQALERVASEFALLINPDAVLHEGALERLVEAADRYPDAALLAPAIVNSEGGLERSFDAGLFSRAALGRKRTGEPAPEGPCCAGFLSGAVTLMRMCALRAVGFFDPAIFLYYEDDDICLRLRAAGHSLVLVPAARASHLGGGSIRPGWAGRWEKFFHLAWSRLYLEAKYRGPGAAARLARRALLRSGVKALGYALILDRARGLREAARGAGTLAYLMGRPASRKARRAP